VFEVIKDFTNEQGLTWASIPRFGAGLKLANVPMASSLQEWLLQLPGVSQSPHRFGGTEYRVNGLEFMHSHSPTYLDIRLSLEDQKQVWRRNGRSDIGLLPRRDGSHSESGRRRTWQRRKKWSCWLIQML